MDFLCQNKELSIEEKDILRKSEEARLKMSEYKNQYLQKRKAENATDKMEAIRLKNLERMRRTRQNRKTAATPEEIEAMRLKKSEQNRQYRQKRKAAAIPGEIGAIILKNSERDRSQNRKSKDIESIQLRRAAQHSQYRKKRRERERSILRKAMELLSQNQLLSIEEKEILRKSEEVKALRLRNYEHYKRYIQKRKAAATHEENEAMRLKKLEKVRHYRQKRKAESTPEELEARRLKILEQCKQYRQMRKAIATPEEIKAIRLKNLERMKRSRQKRKAAANPEETEAMRLKRLEYSKRYRQNKRKREQSILRQAMELLRQNKEMSSDEREVLRLAEKIKADRLRRNKRGKRKQKNVSTVEERERAAMLGQLRIKTIGGWLREDQVFDEIKIEKEVVQETTIKAISAPQNSTSVLDMQQGGYNDSSCSWLELSEKSFMTGETSKNHSYLKSFHEGSSRTQFDQKRFGLEKSFRCMKVLIDATAKRDGHTIFGKHIAQKLRSSKKDRAEFNIAKQLIDDILQNLAIGVYSFKTKIV